MASKRMFSQKIVGSDAFLEMPVSARELYFQLGMYADDDGFINPKKIVRMIGASDDDLKILEAKRFVLKFENGVIVIKHWLINNLIRKDFYQETQYLEQKKTLFVKENKSYTDSETEGVPLRLSIKKEIPVNYQAIARTLPGTCKQIVNKLFPQDRLGKDRLGKDNRLEAKASEITEESFNLEEYLSKLATDPKKHIRIISLYWKYKQFTFQNKKQAQDAIKRDLRAAERLTGYDELQIEKTLQWLKTTADYAWKLETVHKFIDEKLDSLTLITNKKPEEVAEVPSYAKSYINP